MDTVGIDGGKMFPNIARYMEMKYSKREEIKVTKEQFIQMMIESGNSPEDAEFHANMATKMNAAVEINGKMVKINE